MTNTLDVPLCQHQVLDGQIHHFKFNAGSRDAIKVWAQHIENIQLHRQWYGKGHLKLFIDACDAVNLPIRYLFEVLSDYNRAYPGLESPRLTMAYLRSPDTVILEIYHMMAELFESPLTVQFFTSEEKALRWLRESN